MTSESEQRLYGDLAAWWPLISPPDEYSGEATFLAGVITSASDGVRDVLELGAGGGHNAFHVKARFSMTLVDMSPDMLEASRRLNPDCAHVQGDMRVLRLDRSFDAVFIHDAIDYMISTADLRSAIETAFAHCRPGGVAVLVPDDIVETFEPSTEHGGSDAPDGRGARYLAWTWDPDPADSWVQTEYAFMLREADGTVSNVNETHRTGLFSRRVWLDLLSGAGFEPTVLTESTTEDRRPREVYVARRPDR